jgi:hypothetical protein
VEPDREHAREGARTEGLDEQQGEHQLGERPDQVQQHLAQQRQREQARQVPGGEHPEGEREHGGEEGPQGRDLKAFAQAGGELREDAVGAGRQVRRPEHRAQDSPHLRHAARDPRRGNLQTARRPVQRDQEQGDPGGGAPAAGGKRRGARSAHTGHTSLLRSQVENASIRNTTPNVMAMIRPTRP